VVRPTERHKQTQLLGPRPQGLKVVDWATVLAELGIGMLMSDLGAHLVELEHPTADLKRSFLGQSDRVTASEREDQPSRERCDPGIQPRSRALLPDRHGTDGSDRISVGGGLRGNLPEPRKGSERATRCSLVLPRGYRGRARVRRPVVVDVVSG
jgi:CoA-transferase family III